MSSTADERSDSSAFERLHAGIQRWIYRQGWPGLREAQERAAPYILDGERDVIVAAATAAGKTEAAFLPICSRLIDLDGIGIKALYVGPLKALINDQFERLTDICHDLNIPVHRWHGDVSSSKKRKIIEKPDGILLITPESLEAMFVIHGHRVAALFAPLAHVVIDELHAFIGSDRGRHLQSLLHRLESSLRRRVPRVGLSATLGDMGMAAEHLRPGAGEQAELIEVAGDGGELSLQIRGYRDIAGAEERDETDDEDEDEIESLTDGLTGRADRDITRHIYRVLRGGTHLIFANKRTTVETTADDLRRMCEYDKLPIGFLPHHGSLSRQLREDVEERLKDRSVPLSVVCTSTLEMGIDIGDVESIAQIGAPFSVASMRQRLGRSGRRGGPATLRQYLRGREITDKTPLLDTLHIELVQSIAMTELLVRDKWCEPPAKTSLQLSTLLHQTLSVIAQWGGVTAADAFEVLCNGGPFRSVERDLFVRLLRQMKERELIEQDADGALLLGRRGEHIVNHYSFFAVFDTPQEFQLTHNGKQLGTMGFDQSLVVGVSVIFSGRRWKVLSVDTDKKVVAVTPTRGGRPPKFLGGSPGRVHDIVRQRMTEVYLDGAIPLYLSATAADMLTEARAKYLQLGIDDDVFVADGAQTVIFLCRGDAIMNTLMAMMLTRGIECSLEGAALVVDTGTDDARGHVQAIAETDFAARDLAMKVANRTAGKYTRELGDDLLTEDYASWAFDIEGARRATERP